MDIGRDELLVRKLQFPPRPAVVATLAEEAARANPDLQRIARAVKGDVALAGAMLKAVNSPAFALSRKLASLDQALSVLGIKNVQTLATGLALRGSIGSAPSMERFWDSAEKVALIGAHLARSLRGIAADEAYSYCLFHDCGIPMLMQRFPNYRETLIAANSNPELAFTQVEEQSIGTQHAVVGYFLARSWHLADHLALAIQLHHDTGIFEQAELPPGTLNLIAIGHIADHVNHLMARTSADLEWNRFGIASLAHLGMAEADFSDLCDDAQQVLRAS